MEKKKNIILALILSLGIAFPGLGMKYKILLLNTPTITIDNRQSKVGDWFDDESVIKWENERQAMKVMSEDNHRYTVSPTSYKESGAKKFKDYITFVKPMAHRGMSNLKEELAERLEGYHVLLDEIEFDLSDIELPTDAIFTAKHVYDNNSMNEVNLKLMDNKLFIERDNILQLLDAVADPVEFEIFLNGHLISNYFELMLAPLIIENE